MLAEDSTLTDEDVHAAARHWLSRPVWSRVLADRVDDLLPGDLRAWHADLPERLLEMEAEDPDMRLTRAQARRYEATCALESAGYGVYDAGLVDRTADALLSLLRERVDQRMRQVFRPEETIAQSSAATASAPDAPPPAVSGTPLISEHVEDWLRAIQNPDTDEKKAIPLHHAKQKRVSVRLLTELIGDKPAGSVTRDDAAELRRLMLQLPASHGKGRYVHAREAIAKAAAADGKKVMMKTVIRTAGTLKPKQANEKFPFTHGWSSMASCDLSSRGGRKVPIACFLTFTRAAMPDHTEPSSAGTSHA